MDNKTLFTRHGEHIPRNGDGDVLCGLTRSGRDEMRSVGMTADIDGVVQAYSVNNLRSLASLTLAMMPQIEDTDLMDAILEMQKSGRLTSDRDLRYVDTVNEEFLQRLNDAFCKGKCLRFHVDKSDSYSRVDGDSPSTYSIMAGIAADKILSYRQTSLVCAREFFIHR